VRRHRRVVFLCFLIGSISGIRDFAQAKSFGLHRAPRLIMDSISSPALSRGEWGAMLVEKINKRRLMQMIVAVYPVNRAARDDSPESVPIFRPVGAMIWAPT
jgi:hypothetical protein